MDVVYGSIYTSPLEVRPIFFSFFPQNVDFFLEKYHNLLKSQYFHEKRVYDLTKRVHRLLNISSEGPWARAPGRGALEQILEYKGYNSRL